MSVSIARRAFLAAPLLSVPAFADDAVSSLRDLRGGRDPERQHRR